jgi:hypothetical protein
MYGGMAGMAGMEKRKEKREILKFCFDFFGNQQLEGIAQ